MYNPLPPALPLPLPSASAHGFEHDYDHEYDYADLLSSHTQKIAHTQQAQQQQQQPQQDLAWIQSSLLNWDGSLLPPTTTATTASSRSNSGSTVASSASTSDFDMDFSAVSSGLNNIATETDFSTGIGSDWASGLSLNLNTNTSNGSMSFLDDLSPISTTQGIHERPFFPSLQGSVFASHSPSRYHFTQSPSTAHFTHSPSTISFQQQQQETPTSASFAQRTPTGPSFPSSQVPPPARYHQQQHQPLPKRAPAFEVAYGGRPTMSMNMLGTIPELNMNMTMNSTPPYATLPLPLPMPYLPGTSQATFAPGSPFNPTLTMPRSPPPTSITQRVSKRVETACNFCRARRIKCNGGRPCTNCANRRHKPGHPVVSCVYMPVPEAQKRRKRTDSTSTTATTTSTGATDGE